MELRRELKARSIPAEDGTPTPHNSEKTTGPEVANTTKTTAVEFMHNIDKCVSL